MVVPRVVPLWFWAVLGCLAGSVVVVFVVAVGQLPPTSVDPEPTRQIPVPFTPGPVPSPTPWPTFSLPDIPEVPKG